MSSGPALVTFWPGGGPSGGGGGKCGKWQAADGTVLLIVSHLIFGMDLKSGVGHILIKLGNYYAIKMSNVGEL